MYDEWYINRYQSKQYLTTHTIDHGTCTRAPINGGLSLTKRPSAHPTDIYALATTPTQILSASGSSSILIHSTNDPEFPLAQTLERAHKLGVHHLTTSRNGKVAASVGFGGELKIWNEEDGKWSQSREIVGAGFHIPRLYGQEIIILMLEADSNKPGEIWAIALSADGQYLAATSSDGRINVWDNLANGTKIREFETKGSFGMSIDIVRTRGPLNYSY